MTSGWIRKMLRAEGLGYWRGEKFLDSQTRLILDLAPVILKLFCPGDCGKDCGQVALDQESSKRENVSGDQVC